MKRAWKYLFPYVCLAILAVMIIGFIIRVSELEREIDRLERTPVEVLFELCGNGAPLVKDGKMYMVVCVPMVRDR